MRRARPAAGFTLIEMLMTLAITSIVTVGIMGTLISQARQYQSLASRRSAQSGNRQGITQLDNALRNAGYGLDPDRAFLAYDGFNVGAPASADLAFPDAVSIHMRDPLFQRAVVSATATKVTFATALTEPLRKGQILLVLCNGAASYAYVTVGVTAAAGATFATLDNVLGGAESPISAPGPRFHEQAKLAGACYQSGVAVKVDRNSFYVASFDDDGNPSTPNQTPYLMLHRGQDLNADGLIDANDSVPVAVGVEQMQLAYVMNATAAAPLVLGVTSAKVPGWGDGWANSVAGPKWTDLYSAAERFVNHPANIRQVRVTLVTRGTQRNEAIAGDDYFNPALPTYSETLASTGTIAWKQMEDLAATPDPRFNPKGGKYPRTAFRLSVSPKNLLTRSQFLPPNSWGG